MIAVLAGPLENGRLSSVKGLMQLVGVEALQPTTSYPGATIAPPATEVKRAVLTPGEPAEPGWPKVSWTGPRDFRILPLGGCTS